MSLLKKEREGVRICTRLVVLAIVFIVVAVGEFLFLCLRKIPPVRFVSERRVILSGNTLNCEPYAAVKLTIRDINEDNENCLTEIWSIAGMGRRQGWVNSGESITFAPDLLGDTGIFIERIEKEKVFVVFLWKSKGPKYRFSWPWE